MSDRRRSVKLVLLQRDYFTKRRRVRAGVQLCMLRSLPYVALRDVLEILEYDVYRTKRIQLIVTDGSEFVTIPTSGYTAKREGMKLRIDPLLKQGRDRFISLRSINRLFNVDIRADLPASRIEIKQPGKSFETMKDDTPRSLARLFETTVPKLLAVNPKLRESIAAGTRITIPTVDFLQPAAAPHKRRKATVKAVTELAPAVIRLGKSLIGTPYRFGAGPYPRTNRFDCSSFIQYIFGRNGVRLPRTSRSQAARGKRITPREVEPGDLVFFWRDRYSDNRIGHVGIDIGSGQMLNTYKSPPGVTITHWNRGYWQRRFVTAREIL